MIARNDVVLIQCGYAIICMVIVIGLNMKKVPRFKVFHTNNCYNRCIYLLYTACYRIKIPQSLKYFMQNKLDNNKKCVVLHLLRGEGQLKVFLAFAAEIMI